MAWSLILCLLPLATLAVKTQTNEYLQPYKFVKPLKSLAELYSEAEMQEEDRTVKKSEPVEHVEREENVEKVPIAEARSGVAHPIVSKEEPAKTSLMSADMVAPKISSEPLPQAQPLKEAKARAVRTRKRVLIEKKSEEEEEEEEDMKDMASNISNHRTEDKKEKKDDTEIGPKAEALKGRPLIEYYEDDEYYYDDEYYEDYEDYEEYEEYYEEDEADIPIGRPGRPSYSNFPPTKPKDVKPLKSLAKPVKNTPEPKRSSNISKPGSYSPSKPKSYSSSKPSSYSSSKPNSYSSSKPGSYSSSKPGSYSPKSYSPSKPKSYSQSKPSSYSPSKYSPHHSSKSSPSYSKASPSSSKSSHYSSKYPKKPSQHKSPYKQSYNIASTLERLKAIKQTQLKRKGLPSLPNPWERFNMKSPPKSSAKSSHRPDYRKQSDDRKSKPKPKPVKPYSDYYEDEYYYDYPSETRNIARQGYGGPAKSQSNPLALLIAPLAGIALLTAAAAVAINPVLVTVSVTGKRRRRRDLDTVVGGDQGITPELEEKIHEMKVLEKFMSSVPENSDYQQQVLSMYLSCSGYTEMTNHCLDRVVCEYANDESTVSQEERDVISIVLYNIMANEFVSEDYKDRLRVAARSGRDNATCLAFECSALAGIVDNHL